MDSENMTDKDSGINEIIVVEGRDDTAAIRAALDAETIETHGYGIREETWQVLEKAYETKGLIIFTDPDRAGELIRRRLTDRFPKARQAFLDQSEATRGGDIGIENASPEAIRRALQKARGPAGGPQTAGGGDAGRETGGSGQPQAESVAFTVSDMDRWGLNGSPGAADRRRALGKELGIGYGGGKSFLRRLNRFGISREEVEAVLGRLGPDR